jgi:hypothetical protein
MSGISCMPVLPRWCTPPNQTAHGLLAVHPERADGAPPNRRRVFKKGAPIMPYVGKVFTDADYDAHIDAGGSQAYAYNLELPKALAKRINWTKGIVVDNHSVGNEVRCPHRTVGRMRWLL